MSADKSTPAKFQVIQLVADGQFHSGEEIGHILKITRSAVWKIIQQLTQLGIEIHRVKGKGYKIPQGIELLDLAKIENRLPAAIHEQINLKILNQIPSTNTYLMNHRLELPSGSLIFSEHQTHGYGRRGKKWLSPFGTNLYFSVLWNFDKDPSELSGLSLATAVAVANTLERYGIFPIQLKWPNDVLVDYKKIAGILIQTMAETHSNTQAVIGIGLNVSMPQNIAIDQPFTDVAKISGQKPRRNQLAAYLIEEVIQMLQLFANKGFEPFFPYWQALDAYANKPVSLHTPRQILSGVAKGINRQGEFILVDDQHQEHRFLHGEVSLRLKN